MNYHEIEETVLNAIEKINSIIDLDNLEEAISLALDKKYNTFLPGGDDDA